MISRLSRLLLLLAISAPAFGQHPSVLLWPNGAPGSEGRTAPEVVTLINAEGEHTAFEALMYPGLPAGLKLAKDDSPAFPLCGAEDRENIALGVPQVYLDMKRAGISAELHVYAGVDGHQGPAASALTL